MIRFGIIFFFLCIAPTLMLGQTPAGTLPDGEAVLKHIEDLYAGINDYTVTLEVSVNVERVKVPPTKLTMYFKEPDKVHFDATSFAMVPRQAVAFNFGMLRQRYDAEEAVELDTVAGHPEYKVILLPKKDRTKLRKVQLFVNPLRWTPDSIRIPSLDGRVMAAGITSQLVEGRWLPAEIIVTFGAASGDSTVPNIMEEVAPNRRRGQPIGGSATIKYSGYKLNTGLSDDLFKEEDGGQDRPDR